MFAFASAVNCIRFLAFNIRFPITIFVFFSLCILERPAKSTLAHVTLLVWGYD